AAGEEPPDRDLSVTPEAARGAAHRSPAEPDARELSRKRPQLGTSHIADGVCACSMICWKRCTSSGWDAARFCDSPGSLARLYSSISPVSIGFRTAFQSPMRAAWLLP